MVGLAGSIVDFKGLRTGLGMDVHALVPGRKLILGGVEITISALTGTRMPMSWRTQSLTLF